MSANIAICRTVPCRRVTGPEQSAGGVSIWRGAGEERALEFYDDLQGDARDPDVKRLARGAGRGGDPARRALSAPAESLSGAPGSLDCRGS